MFHKNEKRKVQNQSFTTYLGLKQTFLNAKNRCNLQNLFSASCLDMVYNEALIRTNYFIRLMQSEQMRVSIIVELYLWPLYEIALIV